MAGRDALRRIMLALGIVPIVVMSAAFWMMQFGPTLALGHVCFADGAVRLVDGDLDAATSSLQEATVA